MVEEKSLKCTLCETEFDIKNNTCPECGITRSIIELEEQVEPLDPEDVESVIKDHEEDIFTLEEDELFSFIKKLGSIAKGTEADFESERDEIVFECPLCGTEVGEHDTKCPGCGAIFEGDVEGEEASSIKEEYERSFVEAKSEFVKVKDIPVSKTIISDLLKQSVIARNEQDYEKAIKRCQEVISVCQEITTFSTKLKRAKELLKFIRERGGRYQDYLKRLVETKQMLERGDIEEGNLLADDILNDLEKSYEFEESLEAVKNEIKRMNKYSISLPFREKLKEAIEARNEGDYQKGIDLNREVIDIVKMVDDTLEIIKEIRGGISKMRKSNMDYKQHVDDLVDAKQILDEGEMDEAQEEFKRILNEINSKI